MKKILFIFTTLVVFVMASVTSASDDSLANNWKTGLVFDITTTQANYSNSWVGGEAGSFNWVSNINGSAERQFSPKFNFKSTLKLSFGQTHSQDKETKEWSKPVKSTDLIDWENVGRFTFGGFVDPFVAFRIESQFLDASITDTNRYLNPMRWTESVGISKVLYTKEKNQILTRLGFALKQNIAKDMDNTNDGGFESVTDVNLILGEKLTYAGKLSLYKAFFFSDSDNPLLVGTEFEDDWKSIDANWENIINATITKIVSVNFYTQLLYDKQISKKARIKQTLGLGLVVKLN